MKNFKKMITMLVMTITMVIIASFTTVSASAIEVTPNTAVNAVSVIQASEDKAALIPLPQHFYTASGSATSDAQYQSVITFFVTWIRRIGAMVALVGAVMFALAIKNNDAEQKQNGLLTMVAGFVVVAITAAVNMFDLFT